MTSTMIKNQEELFTRNYILPGWTGGFSAGFIFPENNSAGANKFCIQKGEGGAETKINPREAGREKFKEGMIRNMPCTGKNIRKGEKKVRRPRYAFQTRSQVDVLDDGYRWRKYGQKAVKNNKFPRSYYRCTQQDCTVKKQVQRLSKDEGIVVTTYEGMHTHPVEKSSDNFEQILSQMQIYAPF